MASKYDRDFFYDRLESIGIRVRKQIITADLKSQLGSQTFLDAIENAIAEELKKLNLPPNLGRFAIKPRVQVFANGDFVIDYGPWHSLEAAETAPAGWIVDRHPALPGSLFGHSGPGGTQAELLVLIEEVRAAVASGDAAHAAHLTWKLKGSVEHLHSVQASLDRARGRASRNGARKGRQNRAPDPDKVEAWELCEKINTELLKRTPPLGLNTRARIIAAKTGKNYHTVQKHFRSTR